MGVVSCPFFCSFLRNGIIIIFGRVMAIQNPKMTKTDPFLSVIYVKAYIIWIIAYCGPFFNLIIWPVSIQSQRFKSLQMDADPTLIFCYTLFGLLLFCK